MQIQAGQQLRISNAHLRYFVLLPSTFPSYFFEVFTDLVCFVRVPLRALQPSVIVALGIWGKLPSAHSGKSKS